MLAPNRKLHSHHGDAHVQSRSTVSGSNDNADASMLVTPRFDGVKPLSSLANESVFESGILASSSFCDLNSADNVTATDKNVFSSAARETSGGSGPLNVAKSVKPNVEVIQGRDRKRKLVSNVKKAQRKKKQSKAQQDKHKLKPGCGMSCKKRCSSKISEAMRKK